MMNPDDKKTIQRNYDNLRKAYLDHVDDICNKLIQIDLIKREQKDDILLGNNTPSSQATALLDLILRRGPKAFQTLYEVSKDLDLYTAADILNPDNKPHEPQEAIEADETESEFAVFDDNFERKILNEAFPPEISSLEFTKTDNRVYKKHNGKDCHPMNHHTRGKPFILTDHTDFSKISTDRQSIELLMRNLSFDNPKVIRVTNNEKLESIDLTPTVQKDCVVLFLISNGIDGCLNNNRTINKLISMLKSSLPGLPKVVFHVVHKSGQSATANQTGEQQGKISDMDGKPCGAENNENNEKKMTDAFKDMDLDPKRATVEYKEQFSADNSLGSSDEKDGSAKPSDEVDGPSLPSDELDAPVNIPKDANIIYIKSTDAGSEILEQPDGKKYTQFIHLLVFMFARCAFDFRYDLSSLLRMINRKAGVLVADTKTSLTKRLHFFPGCPQNDSS